MTVFRPTMLMLFVLALGSSGVAAVESNSVDMMTPGLLPAGWATAITGTGEPKWLIAKDESAGDGLVLKQSGWTPNPSFPLCIAPRAPFRDGFVEVKFKPIGGTNDQAGGVVWRYRDPANYYVARANALEDNVVLYKVENGKRKALDIFGRQGGYGVSAKVPRNEWSTLRVDFAGKNFHVFINGKELFSVQDSTFPDAGKVGLWTKADSVTLFRDFKCTPP